MRIVFKFAKPYKGKLAAVAALHALATFASLLMPYVMSLIVDEGISQRNASVIFNNAGAGAIIAAL